MKLAVIAENSVSSTECNKEDCYGVEDALQSLRTLSGRDKVNLIRLTDVLAGRGNFASAEELWSEAYVRIAEGKRHWPKDKTFPYFMAGVLRSLATDRMFLTDARQIQRLEGGYSVVPDGDLSNIADDCRETDTRRKALTEYVFRKLEAHFGDDDEMRLLLIGIQDGLIGKKLQEAVGVDATRLEALRTRLNRQAAKMGDGYREMERQTP